MSEYELDDLEMEYITPEFDKLFYLYHDYEDEILYLGTSSDPFYNPWITIDMANKIVDIVREDMFKATLNGEVFINGEVFREAWIAQFKRLDELGFRTRSDNVAVYDWMLWENKTDEE